MPFILQQQMSLGVLFCPVLPYIMVVKNIIGNLQVTYKTINLVLFRNSFTKYKTAP